MIFGSAVTFQTPTHAVRFGMVNDFHMVDVAVTSHTTDATVDVDGMIEIDVIRCLMNSNPRHGVSAFPRLAHGTELRAL